MMQITSPENCSNNSTFPHKLTKREQIKGGKSKSIQKSISAKLRTYTNRLLNCKICKTHCSLYDANADDCQKGIILSKIRALGRTKDPFEVFDEMFNALAEMRIELMKDYPEDTDGRIKFQKLNIYLQRLEAILAIKFNDKTIAHETILTPSIINRIIREGEKQDQSKY